MTTRVLNFVLFLTPAMWLPVRAQSAAPVDPENAAVERYATEGAFSFRTNLHMRSGSFDDGAKGSVIAVSRGEPPILWLPNGTVLAGPEALLRGDSCNASAIVVAKEISSATFITASKTFIYTKHEFAVQRIFKAPEGIAVGGTLHVIQVGGSLYDGGELVRLAFAGLTPFLTGQSYLLILRHRSDAAPNTFVPKRYAETIHITSNHLSIPKGEVMSPAAEAVFVQGMSIKSIFDSLTRSTEDAACDK